MKPRSQIGDEIRRRREAIDGFTQAELAEAVGVDSQTVSRWERGERQPKADVYKKVIAYIEKRERDRSGLVHSDESGEEKEHIADQVRSLATRFAIRRAQGATPEELRRLNALLRQSVRNALEASAGDDGSLDFFTDEMVGLLTTEGRAAPRADQARSAPAAATKRRSES